MADRLRIPAMLRAFDPNRRRAERVKLQASNDRIGIDFVVVTDISPEGARLITPVPFQLGTSFKLKLPLLKPICGTVMWVSKRLAGCRFERPLHPALLRVLLASARADPDAWQQQVSAGPFHKE